MPEVDRLQMDLEWVKRLFAIMDLVSRVVVVIGFLFILAVMLVISNTIRLAIENRRKEIAVAKLVGGTDSFVRRPFLYMGLWFGAGGALIAALLIELGFGWLNQSVVPLASSYGSNFRLSGLDVISFVALQGIGMSLGWLGARLAVRRHLQGIEP
jgi:cell division transport system permease protein